MIFGIGDRNKLYDFWGAVFIRETHESSRTCSCYDTLLTAGPEICSIQSLRIIQPAQRSHLTEYVRTFKTRPLIQ
jgi:hypothetical protein